MKKILSLLAAVGLTATASTAVVSCQDIAYHASKFGSLVKTEISKPDKKTGIIKATVIARGTVPEHYTVDEALSHFQLLEPSTKDKETSLSKPAGIDDYKVALNEKFYADNLGKKGDKEVRVEVKITWTVKAQEKASKHDYYVVYKLDKTDQGLIIGKISVEYYGHHYPNESNNKNEKH